MCKLSVNLLNLKRLQTCFLDNLFQFADSTKDLYTETRNFLDLYTSTNNLLLNNFKSGINLVYDIIVVDPVNALINEFQECCTNIIGKQ